jgi:hypothetical protein
VYTLTPIDESLNRAFLLAHFIIGNKQHAVRVVSQAMAKLEVAASAQGKRLYYKAAERSRGPLPFRTKVTFSELHLLQRLIYIEAEPYEREKEQEDSGAAVRTEDLIVHFIKHLARITSRRNSFYVTLGLSRLLYSYTTAETMAIYNVVVQDPERVKDDYYYRSRKGVLLREMKDRFGDLIRVGHAQRGEERFESDSNSGKFVELVRECLSFFTPWMTSCSVPASINPIAAGIPPLSSSADTSEHEVELNRIHAVFHPDCYQHLTQALRLESPEDRLEIPQFYLSNENKNGGEAVRTPKVGLDEEDLAAIKDDLSDLAKRRKKASAGFLQFLLDGAECARLDLKKASHVRFNVDSSNELLEIRSTDQTGDLLLASHLFSFDKQDQPEPIESSIVLEGRQKISINIVPLRNASGLTVDIGYKETNPIKAGSRAVRGILANAGFGLAEHSLSRILIPVSAVILLLVGTIAVVTYLQRRTTSLDSQSVAKLSDTQSSTPTTTDTPKPKETIAVEQTGSRSGETQAVGKSSGSPTVPSAANSRRPSVDTSAESISGEEEITRSVTRTEPGVMLREVKSIYVESADETASSRALRNLLVVKLSETNRFTLSQKRDDADAILKVRATSNAESSPSAFGVQLINARGKVIWPLKGKGYSAPTVEEVGSQIVRDLLADLNTHERGRYKK